MRFRMDLLPLVLPFVLTWSSCAGPTASPSAPVEPQSALFIDALFPDAGERRPIGWIYALDDAQGRKNRCVYVWSDRTWSLAEETSPGYFGDEIVLRRIGVENDAGVAPALDFPTDALDGWRTVYVAGSVSATYKGLAIPRKS